MRMEHANAAQDPAAGGMMRNTAAWFGVCVISRTAEAAATLVSSCLKLAHVHFGCPFGVALTRKPPRQNRLNRCNTLKRVANWQSAAKRPPRTQLSTSNNRCIRTCFLCWLRAALIQLPRMPIHFELIFDYLGPCKWLPIVSRQRHAVAFRLCGLVCTTRTPCCRIARQPCAARRRVIP